MRHIRPGKITSLEGIGSELFRGIVMLSSLHTPPESCEQSLIAKRVIKLKMIITRNLVEKTPTLRRLLLPGGVIMPVPYLLASDT